MSRLSRRLLFGGLISLALFAQEPSQETPKQTSPQPSQPAEQEPPEEDVSPGEKAKEYTLNPIQAEKEMSVGKYYAKRGSWKAAAKRYSEATKWNPGLAEAYLRLGEAQEKLKNEPAAKAAYEKYVELAPDSKEAASIRKRFKIPGAKG